MKKIYFLTFFLLLCMFYLKGQENGIYFSDDYEFVDLNNADKCYRIQAMNYLLISLNVVQGKFTDGELFWEGSTKETGAIFYKWKIHSIANPGVQISNLFYKSYLCSKEVSGIDSRVFQEIHIIKNVFTNSYDIAIHYSDTETRIETKMVFHNIKKIEEL